MRVTTSPFAETNALRAILNLVQEFILWIDEHGHIIDANASVSHSLGYSIEEVKQLTIFEVNPHLNL
jgi:PAS domain S-box-containing protein